MSMTVKRKFRVEHREKGRKVVRQGEPKPEMPVDRVPRISRLMALAIRFEVMIRSGEVKDQAELARLGHVTRARLSQIMNLLNLAPEIQEELLFLRNDHVSERVVRTIMTTIGWQQQRRSWSSKA